MGRNRRTAIQMVIPATLHGNLLMTEQVNETGCACSVYTGRRSGT